MKNVTLIANPATELPRLPEGPVSPFVLYEGETFRVHQNDHPTSLALTDLDKLILMHVNKYRILTSAQIIEVMRKGGLENAEDDKIKSRLKALTRSSFLQCSGFESPDGRVCFTHFYSIGYRGRGLLKAMGVARISSYVSQIADTPWRAKKITACNQFLIRTGVPFDAIEHGHIVLAPAKNGGKVTECIFRPTALVQGERTLLVEGVRTNDGWWEELEGKLARVEKVLKKREHNVELKNPMVVLVCESLSHMEETMDALSEKHYGFPIACTCDPLTYQMPDHCLYAVKPKKSLFRFLQLSA